jgi:hypothetical protein
LRTKCLVLFSLLTLLAALSVYAQTGVLHANIPFAFSAAGKQFPAGQYQIAGPSNSEFFTITSIDGKNSATVIFLTRLAGAIHTTPADAHIVFDTVGGTYTLSELWFPGDDGYMLNTMKGQHSHRVVDVPVK